MRSERIHNITGERAAALTRGALYWREYLLDESKHARWQRWLNKFEPDVSKQNAVYKAVQDIAHTAYKASLYYHRD